MKARQSALSPTFPTSFQPSWIFLYSGQIEIYPSETRFLHHVSLNLNMSLVAHSLKKNPYPIGIFHFSFEYSREILQRAVFYSYSIAWLDLLINPNEAIFSYVGSN
jgi:hypothetical protein